MRDEFRNNVGKHHSAYRHKDKAVKRFNQARGASEVMIK